MTPLHEDQSERALTYSIDDCDSAFVRDFLPYKGSPDPHVVWRAAWQSCMRDVAARATPAPVGQPIDMVLHCPACGMQHVDKSEEHEHTGTHSDTSWANPPHRSHLCHGCGHIWRPADVPTNGVEAVKTKGQSDSPAPAPVAASEAPEQGDDEGAVGQLEYRGNSVSFIHEKMRAYRLGIDNAWAALRRAGIEADGKIDVAAAIDKLAARPTSPQAAQSINHEAAGAAPLLDGPRKASGVAIPASDTGEGFDSRRQDAGSTPALVAPQAAPEAVPLTDELRGLDTETRVRFYEHDFYVLSNFSAFTLQWKGIRFDTSEAAYHWEKFTPNYTALRDEIRLAPSAHEAFKLAERNKHCRRHDWDSVKVGIMLDILRAKADQHEYVRRKLLATGDRELVEDSWRDDFWGWGPSRDGQNMLGKLWMEIRAELRAALAANGIALSGGSKG